MDSYQFNEKQIEALRYAVRKKFHIATEEQRA
jgi:hypothetical protein